ncbi:restriction endonuclease subunit S [Lepagella muris]|uniref:restriction endonuclease subunit S n=2 Tax=Bacteria TaxID=2 RepID=UPI0023B85C87|nr:restriction endonuclease subunit S [Lepagella muris]
MANNNQHTKPNVPPLRFPGFSDEWETYSINEISNIVKGSGISKEQLSKEGEECILYGELYTKYKSEIIDEVFSKTDINSTKLTRSQHNDVIIPCSGESAEDIATARCVTRDGILLGGDLNIIRFNGQNGAFMSYQLNGKRKYDIARVTQGVSVVHLYPDHLKSVKVSTPSLKEQNRIVKLLSLIDKRISTQNKIIEKLQSLIKGLRTFIFSGLFESYAKLGEIAKLYQPQTISTSELQSEGYIVYGANGIIGHYHSYNHARPQICITCRGNTCGQVSLTSPFSWITGNAMVVNIENKVEINQIYLFHFLKNYNFNSIITGSGQPQIVRTPLERIKVPITNLTEQKRIANTLDTNNKNLIIECNLKELYVRQKQFLLQKLFI